MSERLQKCPLCDRQQIEKLMITRDRHYGIPGQFSIARCLDCGLVFLNPMYSDRELATMYPEDYYAYQRVGKSGTLKRLVKKLLGYQIRTRDPRFERPGKALDIGCGTGWFLGQLRDKGWEVCGVEINESAARLGREVDGINIFSGRVSEAGFPSETFDYIRLNHSFEHMSCPNQTLAEIHRILKPKGLLMIGVPNYRSLNARLFGRYWWYLGAPVHTFTYSVKTLSRMLNKHGFKVRNVIYNSDFGGILGSLQIWLNRNSNRKSTEGFFINVKALRVLCYWCAKLMDLFHAGDAIEITASRLQLTRPAELPDVQDIPEREASVV